jgi:glycosyltransferase involved in cell wall biosynthesis
MMLTELEIDGNDQTFPGAYGITGPGKATISVVTSLYHSAPYVEEFYRRILAQLQKIDCEYEIIFVDDGSPDRALDVAMEIARRDPKVCVAELSRNFGHYKALMTGLELAKGELVFLVDVDLEEPPEALSLFYDKLEECSADVVFGVQQVRRAPWYNTSVFAVKRSTSSTTSFRANRSHQGARQALRLCLPKTPTCLRSPTTWTWAQSNKGQALAC